MAGSNGQFPVLALLISKHLTSFTTPASLKCVHHLASRISHFSVFSHYLSGHSSSSLWWFLLIYLNFKCQSAQYFFRHWICLFYLYSLPRKYHPGWSFSDLYPWSRYLSWTSDLLIQLLTWHCYLDAEQMT